MKIGVAGTGAVGGYFGGILQKAGNDVVFLARGESLDKMKEKGLTIESEAGSINVGDSFTERYDAFSEVELVLFCVKSTQTTEVATNLFPHLKKDCLILTLQNGVDNEEILSSIFGGNRVLSAATYIQAMVPELGVVKQIGVSPRLVIGAIDPGLSEKVMEISSLFQASGIDTFPSRDILKVKWKKLLWNVSFNPLTALIESRVSAIFEDEGIYQIAAKICQEAIAVARKSGLEIEEDFYEKIKIQGQLARDHQTSMLQDKLKGRAMELESICGYIVKKGKVLNVETPVLETVYHLLHYQEQNKRAR